MPISDTPTPRHVLVLQGGGALGSYQAGVYEALHEAGAQPDWLAGISIGAINCAIIAGNPPETRVARLREFWTLVSSGWEPPIASFGDHGRSMVSDASAAWTATLGAPGFFTPRIPGPVFQPPGSPGALSLYDTAPLKATLERLVDFDRLNSGETRLSVGAVNIHTGNFAYFDNDHQRIVPEHIMASGALPPGFPPVEIDGQWYWDGGIVSNTPLEYVLDEDEQDDLLIHQVDLFNARGPMPRTLAEAAEREKDIRFSSRTRLNTDANLKLRQAKAAIRALVKILPQELAADPNVAFLSGLARESSVAVVQLIYRRKPYEGGFADFEFSRQTMLDHWSSGVEDARHALQKRLATPAAGEAKAFDPNRDEPSSPAPRTPA